MLIVASILALVGTIFAIVRKDTRKSIVYSTIAIMVAAYAVDNLDQGTLAHTAVIIAMGFAALNIAFRGWLKAGEQLNKLN